MKKTIASALFCMMIFLGAPIDADAAPSLNGSTGMINTPTADVLRPGQFSLGYYSIKNGSTGSIGMNLAPKLELGLAGRWYDNKAISDSACFNAKYALTEETVLTPGIAVGVEDIGAEEQRSWYVSASKGLVFGIRMHVGYGNGRYDGVFAAVEKKISPISIGGVGSTNLIAEWDGNQFNYGLRMSIASGLKIDVGMRKHNGYVGFSFTS